MDGQDGQDFWVVVVRHPTHGCMNPLRARFARRVPLLLRKRGRETVWVVMAPPSFRPVPPHPGPLPRREGRISGLVSGV